MARGPRCFRCLIFTLSGPVELLFLVSFMACVDWWLEMRMGSQCSFFVCLSTFLFVLLVVFYSVYELFVEGGCFLYGCSGWFVVELDVFVGLFRLLLVVESVQCVPVSVSVVFVVPFLFKFVFPLVRFVVTDAFCNVVI